MASISVLDRELYAIPEAARLLDLPARKLRRWLDGFTIGAKTYLPVIRLEPTGSESVTWAEFVEAGFLREYRAEKVSLQHLRSIIEVIRQETGVPYPLAQYRPLIASRELVMRLDFSDLDGVSNAPLAVHGDSDLDRESKAPLAVHRGPSWQLLWGQAVELFLRKVDFDAEGIAERVHPLGKESPVALDPRLVFGVPQVGGIRTETIAEAYLSGETPDQIAVSYAIPVEHVHAALRWELQAAA